MTPMQTRSLTWPAMGCQAHVVVVSNDASVCFDALQYAQERIEHLEARWSRFRATSEISKLNEHRGRPVVVSTDTYRLVQTATQACSDTDGRFDPTVIDAICAVGYDRDIKLVRANAAFITPIGQPAPGCSAVRLDPILNAVSLGEGVGFDAGGIGKGLAADIVVSELRKSGIEGAMVNVGGDVAVDGTPPNDDGWIVGIQDPHDPTRIVGRVTIEAGGVCTSSRVGRSWTATDGTRLHHLIDPRTGTSLETPILTTTVVAGSAAWAEALTTAMFVASGEHAQGATQFASLLVNAHACCITEHNDFTTYGEPGVFDFTSDRAAP